MVFGCQAVLGNERLVFIMTKKELIDSFSKFELDEQIFLGILIKHAYCEKFESNYIDNIFDMIGKLRSVFGKLRPKYLSFDQILRNKRVLFLSISGLNLILKNLKDNEFLLCDKKKLSEIKFVIEKEIAYLYQELKRVPDEFLIATVNGKIDLFKEYHALMDQIGIFELKDFKPLIRF